MKLRALRPSDSDEAAQVFFDAVMHGTAAHYSLAQRQAWAGPAPDPEGWRHKFSGINGVAADQDGRLIGFMTLDQQGYIDLAFVSPDHAGRGVGRQLYTVIKSQARQNGLACLTTEAQRTGATVLRSHGLADRPRANCRQARGHAAELSDVKAPEGRYA